MFAISEKTPFDTKLPEGFLIMLKPLHESITSNYVIADKLLAALALEPEAKRAMEHWVYIGRHNLRDEAQKLYREKMVADGWLLLNDIAFDTAVKNTSRLYLIGQKQTDWLSSTIEGIYKPITDGQGNKFLVAPGKRTRGYYLNSLMAHTGNSDCFCKLVA